MKTPDLSFVIPVHNGEAYLADAIGSCLSQSYKNIQVVVVNDQSKDASLKLAEWYAAKDERVTVISTPASRCGRGQARNLGNRTASAPYIAVLDADDMSDKERAKQTLKIFKREGDCLVYGAAAILDALGNQIGDLKAVPFDPVETLKIKMNRIVHSTSAYPKSITKRFQYPEDEYGDIGLDDWHFQTRAFHIGGLRPVMYSGILAGYRRNFEGITATRNYKRVLELKEEFAKRYEFFNVKKKETQAV